MNKKLHTRKINALLRAQDVQDFYRQVRVEGQPDTYVWRTHIFPRFRISLNTFYLYLSMRPAHEIEKLEKQKLQDEGE